MRNKIIEATIDKVVDESNYPSDFKKAFKQFVKNKFDDNAKESDLKRILSLLNENGEEINQNSDGKCDLCAAQYSPGKATFVADEDDPTQLNKIIISGSAVKEIIIPAKFKTIASNVITVAGENVSEEDIRAAKNGIESIVFARDSVCNTIEENAFGYCENLKLIDLPDTIKTIGKYAFTNQNQQGAVGFKVRYDSPKVEWDSITKTAPYIPTNATLETTPEES